MNLDDLMEVWRSQDAAPLHGVNETLLRLALRQDEAKLQKWRRMERWFIYVMSAVIVAGMALFLAIMIVPLRRRCADPVGTTPFRSSARPPPCSGRVMYVSHRAQALREQRFGESLRDQLNRQYRAARLRGDDARLDDPAGHCAAADRSVRSPSSSPVWRINEPILQRRWLSIPIVFMIC